ncbi:relaxase/mobilization nuclease domain-containing protein, partial [Ruminococcus sp. 1001136sp1]
MATTRLMPLHVGKGRNISTAIADIIDYVENPQKTDFGKFIYGYECDTRLADAEFLLSKRQYANLTGRNQGADDVIAYHLRQAFKPGEVTPEEANQIGRELALKLTKGNHAFVVCTHVDKHHVHNHIIINSTTLDCQKKFRNFWGSTWAIRRMNDKLCLEHGLSIVENPKPSREHYGTWLGNKKQPSFQEQIRIAIDAALEEKPKDFEELLQKLETAGLEVNRERKHLRFRVPGQENYTRCDTLKGDYTEQAIKERIAGTRTVKPRHAFSKKTVSKVGLLVDIEVAIRSGKGPGYERWAKVFNLKQLSQAVLYLKEHGDMGYEDLLEKANATTTNFNTLSVQIKDLESKMNANAELQKQIVNYAKTRAVYVEYRKAGYSKKFRTEHEAEILLHQAAKNHFDELGIKKLPSVKSLREEYTDLLEQKRKAYSAYKQAKNDMK